MDVRPRTTRSRKVVNIRGLKELPYSAEFAHTCADIVGAGGLLLVCWQGAVPRQHFAAKCKKGGGVGLLRAVLNKRVNSSPQFP